MDWSFGYRTDVEYTYGYYNELNPLRIKLALLNAGFDYPKIRNACELGFGQGLSLNFHSLDENVSWFGTDFNPTQAAYAKFLNETVELGSYITDDDFENFCCRSDLPDFDFIVLHGIWSWISSRNKKILTNFLRTKLKLGGVLYISYNTFPGAAKILPLRELLLNSFQKENRQNKDFAEKVQAAFKR